MASFTLPHCLRSICWTASFSPSPPYEATEVRSRSPATWQLSGGDACNYNLQWPMGVTLKREATEKRRCRTSAKAPGFQALEPCFHLVRWLAKGLGILRSWRSGVWHPHCTLFIQYASQAVWKIADATSKQKCNVRASDSRILTLSFRKPHLTSLTLQDVWTWGTELLVDIPLSLRTAISMQCSQSSSLGEWPMWSRWLSASPP